MRLYNQLNKVDIVKFIVQLIFRQMRMLQLKLFQCKHLRIMEDWLGNYMKQKYKIQKSLILTMLLD
ncbi:unnamed protein product [Paramecium sonneborni]|uniref:Uncharacterized protein n=1 Tax=Paramecium sonneborni TaxID=65129 RepID=A0A8S1N482_9CILI|nr:unnamed protein product [Paramecium sonneborni]